MKKSLILFLIPALLFQSCSKSDKDKLNESEITLRPGESFQLQLVEGDDKSIKWNSDNEFVAEVTNLGEVTANKVGKATIAANKATCEVTVNPRYTTYIDPVTEWGIKKNDLIKKLGTPTYDYSNNKEAPSNEIAYDKNNNKAPLEAYLFDDNNRLTTAGVYFSILYYEELASFLDERYEYYGSPSGSSSILTIHINSNKENEATTLVAVGVIEGMPLYWLILYMDAKEFFNETRSENDKFETINKKFKEIANELKNQIND